MITFEKLTNKNLHTALATHKRIFYKTDAEKDFTASINKDAYYKDGILTAGIMHDFVAIMPDKYRSMFWADSFNKEALIALSGPSPIENGYSIDPADLDALFSDS